MRIIKRGRYYQTRGYLISQFWGFKTFRGYNFSEKSQKLRKLGKLVPAKFNTFKVVAAKKSSPSVYIMDTVCFGECFLFRVITGGHSFLYKLIVTERFSATAMLLRSLKQVF